MVKNNKCGTTEKHCCWINGNLCRYLVSNVNGRKWACSLLLEHSCWEDVYKDPRYINNIKPELEKINLVNCNDWPPKGHKCNACGDIGG